jgi:hypothetical protein
MEQNERDSSTACDKVFFNSAASSEWKPQSKYFILGK